jgi:integrase
VESLKAKAEKGIEHLNEADVRKFRDAERARNKTAKSCNLSVKIVRMALRAAHRQGLIPRNPAEALSPLIEDDSTEREPFTLEEVAAILAKASTDWRGVILLGLYGGLRLRDATDLKWKSVDLLEKVVRYKPRKTKRSSKEVVLPMHPSLETYFLGLPAPESDQAWIFPNLAEQPTGGRRGLSRRFIELMWEAGVSEGGDDRPESARSVPVRSFHALRHTASSLMAKSGVSKELRMKVVGHASDDVHDHYTHHDLATVRSAIEFIPTLKKA